MKNRLLASLVGVALLGTACVANAAVVLPNTSPGATLGIGGVGDIGQTVDSPGLFSDNYFFTTLASTSVGVGVASIEILSAFSVSGLQATLFNSAHMAIDSGTNFLLAPVPPGTYEVTVTGDAIGPSGGAYAGIVNVTAPVPLPAAVWLLLSGIAGVGSFARRRKTEVLA